MDRQDAIKLILEIAKTPNAFDRLEDALSGLSKEQISESLLQCGIIPEQFKHDSSEEKLWAKYCDILLAKSLTFLNIEAQVLRTRGDSADVFGRAKDYTIVADAKAFRLSRTAKNQKDFKITALDSWRRRDTFACLVCPLYQYPKRNSQIYYQAEVRNVTLLSYIHLKLMLDYPPQASLNLLWRTPKQINPSPDAQIYWLQIEQVMLQLTKTNLDYLQLYKQMEIDATKAIGMKEIVYLESVIADYHLLSQQEAVARLIQAEKIEERIRTVRTTIAKDVSL